MTDAPSNHAGLVERLREDADILRSAGMGTCAGHAVQAATAIEALEADRDAYKATVERLLAQLDTATDVGKAISDELNRAKIEALEARVGEMQTRLDRWEPKPVVFSGSTILTGSARQGGEGS